MIDVGHIIPTAVAHARNGEADEDRSREREAEAKGELRLAVRNTCDHHSLVLDDFAQIASTTGQKTTTAIPEPIQGFSQYWHVALLLS